jgi:hypothetical protein
MPGVWRDFARLLNEGEWRAVHLGVLKFNLLNEETNRRWVSEDCPGKRLPGEGNDERIKPGGEVQAGSKHRPDTCLRLLRRLAM